MPAKTIHVDGIGDVPFYKRRGTTSVKIRISGSDVKVSLPTWMPYKAAVLYVTQKVDWVNAHRKSVTVIQNGSRIGQTRTVYLRNARSSRFSSSITADTIIARIPEGHTPDEPEIQNKLIKLCQRALQTEAEELIIPRVRALAKQYDFEVNKIEIKNLKSRWGHCSSKKDLAFSLFLSQLPDYCIDYVIFHELAHTIHMNHSSAFWKLVAQYMPNYKHIRTQMKQYAPQVIVQQA